MTDAKKQDDSARAQDADDTARNPSEIADGDLDAVTGGLMSTGGVSSTDSSVCISRT